MIRINFLVQLNFNLSAMKTKTLLILCLFFGIGLTQLSAQTKTVKIEGSVPNGYFIPIYCNGIQVDYLVGDFSYKVEIHYVDGIPTWQHGQAKGQLTSSTGEVFKLKETDMKHAYYGCDMILNYNLIGNNGNHYIGTLIWDWCIDPFLLNPPVIKAICN